MGAPRGLGWCAIKHVLLATIALAIVALPGCALEDEPMLEYTPERGAVEEMRQADRPLDSDSTISRTGPLSEKATTSVRAVFTVCGSGDEVALVGEVAQLLSRRSFTLDDGTGVVRVECEEPLASVRAGDIVVVNGAVDIEESPFRVTVRATGVEPE